MANTVRVRIAVAVDADAEWSAAGAAGANDSDTVIEAAYNLPKGLAAGVHWVEADIPIPEPTTIEGSVTGG